MIEHDVVIDAREQRLVQFRVRRDEDGGAMVQATGMRDDGDQVTIRAFLEPEEARTFGEALLGIAPAPPWEPGDLAVWFGFELAGSAAGPWIVTVQVVDAGGVVRRATGGCGVIDPSGSPDRLVRLARPA